MPPKVGKKSNGGAPLALCDNMQSPKFDVIAHGSLFDRYDTAASVQALNNRCFRRVVAKCISWRSDCNTLHIACNGMCHNGIHLGGKTGRF